LFQLFGRQRSGGSKFKSSPGKKLARPSYHSISQLHRRQWVRGSRSETGPGKKCMTLPEKQLTQRRVCGVLQVAEHLSSKCQAQSSNSSTIKKKFFIINIFI
jgi:hypothetical protein